MATSTGSSRRLSQQANYSKPRRWFIHSICPVAVCFLLLLCITFVWSPTAVSGANFRNTLSRLSQALGRLRVRGSRRRRATGAPSPHGPHRISRSLPDVRVSNVDEDEDALPVPGGEEAAALPVGSDSRGREELAVKMRLDIGPDRSGESPLVKFIPPHASLLLRYRTGSGLDFADLRQRRYLPPTNHSLWHLVTISGKKHVLRIICAPLAKSDANAAQVEKLLDFEMEASTAVTSRIPSSGIDEAVNEGLGVPLLAGMLVGIPKTYESAGMTCGNNGLVYPAFRHDLTEVLTKVVLSDAALLYLTRAVVRCTAAMHMRQMTHGSLSLSSFRLDETGKVFIFIQHDNTYGGWNEDDAAGGTTTTGRTRGSVRAAVVAAPEEGAVGGVPGGLQGPVGRLRSLSERPGTIRGTLRGNWDGYGSVSGAAGGWAVDSTFFQRLPGPLADTALTLRRRHGPAARVSEEESFAYAEARDSSELAYVVFQIWCGPVSNTSRRSQTVDTERPFSLRHCGRPLPTDIKKLIRKLQHTRQNHKGLPRELVARSRLFQDDSRRGSSSSSTTS